MKSKCFALLGLMFLCVEPGRAMHIMEGYLPIGWCAFWYAVTLPFLFLSYRHIRQLVARDPRQRVGFAMNAAFVFVLSALKLPSLTGSSSHLTGTTLGTLTTGVLSMPLVGFVVLLFQALLLAHGGLSTLGANIFSLAVVAPFVAYLLYTALLRVGANRHIAIFLAASLGSLATYMTTSLQLAVVFPDAEGGMWASFMKFMGIFALTQVPLAVVEGVMTVLVMRLLSQIGTATQAEKQAVPRRHSILLSLGAVLCLAVPILGGYIDFGEGADDRAGEMVEQLNNTYNAEALFTSFEPSEALEPWLFALQVLIGIVLFVLALRYARKLKA